MKLLKSLSIAAGLAFITISVSAQDKGTGMDPATMAQKQTDQIKSNVTGITPDQESKILAVEKDFAQSMKDAREASNGDRDAFRAKMEPARKDRDTKIKAILTADQGAQYDKYIAAHQAQMGHNRGGN